MTREKMIEALEKLDEPYITSTGPCPAGFDLDVATADGGGTACWAWGSEAVEGPVRLTKTLQKRIAALGEDDELPDDLDEDAVALFKAMVAAKCKPGVDYFHILTSEDGDRQFSTRYAEVYDEWAASALACAELTPWAEMDDDELEEWFEKVAPRRTRKRRAAKERAR